MTDINTQGIFLASNQLNTIDSLLAALNIDDVLKSFVNYVRNNNVEQQGETLFKVADFWEQFTSAKETILDLLWEAPETLSPGETSDRQQKQYEVMHKKLCLYDAMMSHKFTAYKFIFEKKLFSDFTNYCREHEASTTEDDFRLYTNAQH